MSKTDINAVVESRWNELIADGKHGFYENLFRIVHEQRREQHSHDVRLLRDAGLIYTDLLFAADWLEAQ